MRSWESKHRLLAVMLLCCLTMSCFFQSATAQTVDPLLQATPQSVTEAPVSTEKVTGSLANVNYPGLTIEASLGYDGVITYLRQLPLRVSLQNDGADFTGCLAMNVYRNDVQYDRYELPVSVASGARIQVEMPVQLSMKQKNYSLELMQGSECVAVFQINPARVLDPATLLIGTLSDNPQSLSYLHITATKDPLKRNELWQTVPLTKETFPSDQKTMETFAFLAVDGIDLRDFTKEQQTALDAWLENGGIVILGGAAQAGTSYPYFEKFTKITAGAPYAAADSTPALLSYLKSAEKPFGQEMMLTEMKGAQNSVVKAEIPLLDVTPVGKGLVMTAAFSLSDKPLNTWQGTIALWQRIMLAATGGRYQQIMEKQTQYYNRDNDYIYSGIMDHIEIENDTGFVLPIVLLLLFVILVGFGSYWFLKKKDKREWLWVTIPSLSILFTIALMLLSQFTSLREPIAVLSTLIYQSSAGVTTEKAAISVAVDSREPMTLAAKNGQIVVTENANNYYVPDDKAPSTPNQLRYTYQLGSQPGLTFANISSWGVNSVLANGTNPPQIKVDGSCWFDEDGLHIRLVNQGEYLLEKGHVLTSYGFCSVDELLPGQSVDYLLQKLDESDKANKPVPNGNGNYPILDGVMLSKTQQIQMDIYVIASAITFPEMWSDSQVPFYPTQKDYEERTLLSSKFDRVYAGWSNNTGNQFHYVTFTDSIGSVSVTINGQAVKRTAQANIVDVELKYIPISESGFVKYGAGAIPVYTAERNDDNVLTRGGEITERYRYFRLQDKPIFCYMLPDIIKNATLSDVSISPSYIYPSSGYELRIFNVKTGQWDSLKPSGNLKDEIVFSSYLNAEGELYVQFMPGTITDTYADMNTPYMTMEGRIQ